MSSTPVTIIFFTLLVSPGENSILFKLTESSVESSNDISIKTSSVISVASETVSSVKVRSSETLSGIDTIIPALSLSSFKRLTSATSFAFILSYCGSLETGLPVTKVTGCGPSIIKSSKPKITISFSKLLFQFSALIVILDSSNFISSISPVNEIGIVTSLSKFGFANNSNCIITVPPYSSVLVSLFNTLKTMPGASLSWLIKSIPSYWFKSKLW